jgi:hypothetical protein
MSPCNTGAALAGREFRSAQTDVVTQPDPAGMQYLGVDSRARLGAEGFERYHPVVLGEHPKSRSIPR